MPIIIDRKLVTAWILLLLVLFRTSGAAATPVTDLAAKVRAEVNTNEASQTISRVYETDRWFTFPKFEETAQYLKSRLQQSGLTDVEIGGAKADGRTQAGFWTMPLAWDVQSAKLQVVSPERSLLCDYASTPTCLGMWSGSTPKEGITVELVDIRNTPWDSVKGKLVLTDRNSANYKFDLVKYGAVGAVNGFSENPALQNGRQWINAWGDNGWGFTQTSTPLLSFSVTPREANHLRELLASGRKVKLHATADTRYYSGRYPWVTGVLQGISGEEEVLVLGHTSEQGAHDNATGVAANIEALAALNRLIASGKLRRPRRSVRVLLMPELYGSLSYITENPDRMRRTVAALTVDTPAASYDLSGTEYTLHMNPHVAKSWADALVLRVIEACLPPGRPWHVAEHTTGTDAYLGEPTIGVPDVWPYSGTGIVTHHNSEDKPETVDPRSLRDLTTMVATYLYYIAGANEADVPWIAGITVDRAYIDLGKAAAAALDGIHSGNKNAGEFGIDRIRYFADRYSDAVSGVLRLVREGDRVKLRNSLQPSLDRIREFRDIQLARLHAAGAQAANRKIDSQATSIIVRRKRLGTIPLDDLPQDQREGYPSGAWDKSVTVALYWCDGKRNLADVIRLTEMEMGESKNFDFVGYFRFLERHKYVDFVN